MNRSDARIEVKRRYAEYLTRARDVGGKPSYICPLCRNGSGRDGDGLVVDPNSDGTRLHCFKCGFHGDVIDLYQAEHACDTGEAFRALYARFNIAVDDVPEPHRAPAEPQRANTPTTAEKPDDGSKTDYVAYYRACAQRLDDPAARAYLEKRGISPETAARYLIGFDPAADPAGAPGALGDEYKAHPCPRLIIPFDARHYMGRSIEPTTDKKYAKLNSRKQGDEDSVPPFNLKGLYNDEGRPVFIVEGAFDALSVIEAGGVAIATNSASNRQRIIESLRERKTKSTLILCMDNDEAGKKAIEALAEGLKELDVPFTQANICAGHKDPNEALTCDRTAFIDAVKGAECDAVKPHSVREYIMQRMIDEIEKLKDYAKRKTGFTKLDEQTGGIYPGLYVVGGITSVGKTTFIAQMADQMAEAGQHVLFFSMEQSRLEIATKSIARRTAIKDAQSAMSAINIRNGGLDKKLDAVWEYVGLVGDRLSVIEGNFAYDALYIADYVKQYIKANHVKPVVIIDYLQVVQASVDPTTGRKPTDARAITDYNVTAFKRMSRDFETPVFVVSSVNRSNYLTPIDFEAFKESGGIEYTADVIWGLQLAAIHDAVFDKEGKIKEKREKIAEAKEAMPREVELVCLKNRYGKSRYSVAFTYYPQFDYFKETGAGVTSSRPARVI